MLLFHLFLVRREKTIRAAFGADDSIDAVSDSAEFDLAALMGRRGGDTQCLKVYGRCRYPGQQGCQIA